MGLTDSVDRGAWQATVHRVTKSWTHGNNLSCMHARGMVCRLDSGLDHAGLKAQLSCFRASVSLTVKGD